MYLSFHMSGHCLKAMSDDGESRKRRLLTVIVDEDAKLTLAGSDVCVCKVRKPQHCAGWTARPGTASARRSQYVYAIV